MAIIYIKPQMEAESVNSVNAQAKQLQTTLNKLTTVKIKLDATGVEKLTKEAIQILELQYKITAELEKSKQLERQAVIAKYETKKEAKVILQLEQQRAIEAEKTTRAQLSSASASKTVAKNTADAASASAATSREQQEIAVTMERVAGLTMSAEQAETMRAIEVQKTAQAESAVAIEKEKTARTQMQLVSGNEKIIASQAKIAQAEASVVKAKEITSQKTKEILISSNNLAQAEAAVAQKEQEKLAAIEKTKQKQKEIEAIEARRALEADKAYAAYEKQAAALQKVSDAAARADVPNQNTSLQTQIDAWVGVSNSTKSAAESAQVFKDVLSKGAVDASSPIEKTTRALNGMDVSAKKTGDSIGKLVGKVALWSAATTLIYGPIRAFREAREEMQLVDDGMVTVRKVTDLTTAQLEELEDQAYATASALGEAASSYMASVAEFSRAGYQDQSAELGELGLKTQLVGDMAQETANQFLLSVDAAYKLEGSVKELNKVLDGANEIDNNYATSLEKIAEGLGKVAPIAAQSGIAIEELTASIGTITAVTQRSGTEAATAFRALVLNILGDTTTEIEDGATWTAGEIAGLRDVIKTYSPEAYKAAQATGALINPMEAIAGLAQSMEDGLLTEQKLMEMVSDIGGKLRTSQLLALIQNWDMYESMVSDFENSFGSADAEVENALDSWSRKSEIFANTWTEFVAKSLDSDVFKGLLDGGIMLLEILGDLDNVLGLVGGALIFFNSKSIVTGFVGMGENVAKTTKELILYTKQSFSATAATEANTAASKKNAAQMTAGKAAISSVLGVIGLLISAYSIISMIVGNVTEEERQKREEMIEGGKAAADEAEEVYRLVSAYEEAKRAGEGLESASENLIEALGYEKEAVSLLGEEYEKLVDAQLAKSKADIILGKAAAQQNLDDEMGKERYYTGGLKGVGFDLNKMLMEGIEEFDGGVLSLAASDVGDIDDAIETYMEAIKIAVENFDTEELGETPLFEWLNNQVDDLERLRGPLAEADEALKRIEIEEKIRGYEKLAENAETEGLSEVYRNIADSWRGVALGVEESNDEIIKSYAGLEEAIAGLAAEESKMKSFMSILDNGLLGQASKEEIDELIGLFPNLADEITAYANALIASGDEAELNAQMMEHMKKELQNFTFDHVTESIENITGAYEDFGSKSNQVEEALENLTAEAPAVKAALYDAETGTWNLTDAALSSAGALREEAMAMLDVAIAAKQADLSNLEASLLSVETAAKGAGIALGEVLFGQVILAKEGDVDAAKADLEELERYRSALVGGTNADTGGSTSSSSSSSTPEDPILEKHEKIIALLRSELSLMQDQERPLDDQLGKMREIQDALHDQAEYMRSIGSEQADINALSSDWWAIQKEIAGLQEALSDELGDAISRELEKAADARDRELEAIEDLLEVKAALRDEELAELDRLRDEAEALDSIAEKLEDVKEAQEALDNARNERNIRTYNASTGQWEWIANAEDVASAEEGLSDAQGALDDEIEDQNYEKEKDRINSEYDELEAEMDIRSDAIQDGYDRLEEALEGIQEAMEEPGREIAEILEDIANYGTPLMKAQVDAVGQTLGDLANYINAAIGSATGDSVYGATGGLLGGGTGSSKDYSNDNTDYSERMLSSKSEAEFAYWASARDSKVEAQGIDIEKEGYRDNDTLYDEWKNSFDRGGIAVGKGVMLKDTNEPEMVLDPELTSRILRPNRNATSRNITEAMNLLLGGGSSGGGVVSSTNTNSDNSTTNNYYLPGGITLSSESEKGLTLKELINSAKGLTSRK